METQKPVKKVIFFILYFLAGIALLVYLLNRKRPIINESNYSTESGTLKRGLILFDSYCASCHAIKEGGIGPRLGGITALLSKKELTNFIKNPGASIVSGNERVILQQEQYKLMMPAFEFFDDQHINDILSYIDQQTKLLDLQPLTVNDIIVVENKRLVPPVLPSGIHIELEDFIQIPRSHQRPPDKGIATLRAHPSGDGTLFVSDQIGIIYRVHDLKIDTFLHLAKRIENFIYEPGIGTGLGSFTFHPDFLNNGLLYTTHTEKYTGKTAINDRAWSDSIGVGLQWVLSEWQTKDVHENIFHGTKREVLRINTPTTAHGVQDIGFAPLTNEYDKDYGLLYLGIGDGGSNNIKQPELGHSIKSLLGTILRLDPLGSNSKNGHYGIPGDNPYADDTNAQTRKEIWAYGFRNPHRLCWDFTQGKRMLVADIGESNVEEINIVEKGGDYGWPTIEGNYGISTRTDLKSVFAIDRIELSKYKLPWGQYDHRDGNAISGGFVYQGSYTALKNKYIFGDIVTGRLFYMNMDQMLTDSTVHEITIMQNALQTDLKQIIKASRVHLRIGYDPYARQLYILTKGDGKIRKVVNASFAESQTN